MKRLALLAVVAGTCFGATQAFAQDAEVGVLPGGSDEPGVSYEAETSYDFDDDIVEGSLVRPDGEMIGGQRHGKESSLIRIRQDFLPEMVQSADEI